MGNYLSISNIVIKLQVKWINRTKVMWRKTVLKREEKSRNSLSHQSILESYHDNSRVANPSVSKARQPLYLSRYVRNNFQNNCVDSFCYSICSVWWQQQMGIPSPSLLSQKNSKDNLLITDWLEYIQYSQWEVCILPIHMSSVKSCKNSLKWKEHHGWEKYNLLFGWVGLRHSGWRDGKEKCWEEEQQFQNR